MHSRINRGLEDRRDTATAQRTRVATVVIIAVAAAVVTVAAEAVSGWMLFPVLVAAGLLGPSLAWFGVFVYRLLSPIDRFYIGLGAVGGIASKEGLPVFGIEPNTNRGLYGSNIEMNATLPDGTHLGWTNVDFKTLFANTNIHFMPYPRHWPNPEGNYRISWRSDLWGEPPLLIGQGSYMFRDGEWEDGEG